MAERIFNSPMDAPLEFQRDVEDFKILCKRLGLNLHYQPTRGDAPPDTCIVTNGDIISEQATAQVVLETMMTIGPFLWDGNNLNYSAVGVPLIQPAGNIIEAILALAVPKKGDD